MIWRQWKPFQDIHLSCCHGFFLCVWPAARLTTVSRDARLLWSSAAPVLKLNTRSGHTSFLPLPPPKGWGGIQRVYLAYTRGTVPKWTAYKRDQVIRKYGPWMDFWMLKGIRKIRVHKTWTKYIVERDWYQAPRGTRGPAGVRNCLQLCRVAMTDLLQSVWRRAFSFDSKRQIHNKFYREVSNGRSSTARHGAIDLVRNRELFGSTG